MTSWFHFLWIVFPYTFKTFCSPVTILRSFCVFVHLIVTLKIGNCPYSHKDLQCHKCSKPYFFRSLRFASDKFKRGWEWRKRGIVRNRTKTNNQFAWKTKYWKGHGAKPKSSRSFASHRFDDVIANRRKSIQLRLIDRILITWFSWTFKNKLNTRYTNYAIILQR